MVLFIPFYLFLFAHFHFILPFTLVSFDFALTFLYFILSSLIYSFLPPPLRY